MKRRVGSLSRAVVRVEVGYTVLLVTAFVLPRWIGFGAWIPALVLAFALAAGQGLLAGRRPFVPVALLAYLGIYAAAGLHSDPDTFSFIEAGKFFAPPVFALCHSTAYPNCPDNALPHSSPFHRVEYNRS